MMNALIANHHSSLVTQLLGTAGLAKAGAEMSVMEWLAAITVPQKVLDATLATRHEH